MAVEDARVRVVEDRRLDAAAEQRLGLAHEVLVERVLARDEHGEAVAAPPGAAPLLAQRRDRAREADRDRAVERADVDPELERVGRRDAEQLAGHQPLLDLAPLRRRVAGAVRREPRRRSSASTPVGREAVDQLGRLAALREADRPQAARRRGRRAGATPRRARSPRTPSSASSSGGFQSAIVRSARGAASPSTTVAGSPSSDSRELAGVRDRRRGEQELRLRAVDAGEPPQAPQHVADVRAEDAAVDVRLVDDDVAEVREHVAPAVVVRQDADVEHVRVREDRRSPTCGSASAARVSVSPS